MPRAAGPELNPAALASPPVGGTSDRLARMRIAITYLWRHHCLPDLQNPRRFTEFVQHRKLFDRDPRLPVCSDKIAAKTYVADRLGSDWVTPTLWQGDALPANPVWPLPLVVKSRHGCTQRAFVRSSHDDWDAIRRRSGAWMAQPYGVWLDEWLYREIPRGLLVEPFIGADGQLPVDYKLYVFAGQVACIQVHLQRETRHRWMLFDRQWRRFSSPTRDADPARPGSLDRMIEAAETLGQGFDFVRVDFYEIDGAPRFGEMTFYPGSGLDPFDPQEIDLMLGRLWAEARR
ncbi:MAG: polysaccharide biosynthesis protein [Blastomonas sp. CACIA14H2]|uniref:ATP-grasp fold amidoligase family protein n=1 Tax=Blastomonas sp. CACIA14H2 TaxID=1419876 RepID=UPI0003D0692A|nr:MAG: polysaccharide biosynthesis protein [Blastomonas sp. CACIA14H2]